MSLQVRFPYVIASVLLTCNYSILYHVVKSPFFICHCEERIEATWQSTDNSPPGCARPASGLHGRPPRLFATSCKLICYKNHRWLTMHRNDSSATKQVNDVPHCIKPDSDTWCNDAQNLFQIHLHDSGQLFGRTIELPPKH